MQQAIKDYLKLLSDNQNLFDAVKLLIKKLHKKGIVARGEDGGIDSELFFSEEWKKVSDLVFSVGSGCTDNFVFYLIKHKFISAKTDHDYDGQRFFIEESIEITLKGLMYLWIAKFQELKKNET
jgi:hypothetical protein